MDFGGQNGVQNLLKSYLKMDPKKGGVLGASWAALGPSLSGSGGPGRWFGGGGSFAGRGFRVA